MRILDRGWDGRRHDTLLGSLAELGLTTREFVEENPDSPTLIGGRVGRVADLCAGTLVDAGTLAESDLRLSGVPRDASLSTVVRLCLSSAVVPKDCLEMSAVGYCEFCTRAASAPAEAARGRVALAALRLRNHIGVYRTMPMRSMCQIADGLPLVRSRAPTRTVFEATDGLDRFVTALRGRAAVEVRLCVVDEVRRPPGGGVSLLCRAGGRACTVDADAAVLACHQLHRLRFDPPLDAPLADALAVLTYGDALKAVLRFRRRFWEQPPYNVVGGIAQTDLEVGKVYYPGREPGPEGHLMIYAMHKDLVARWRRLSHADRVAMYVDAVQRLHPATDVRALLVDVEEAWWFGPWASSGEDAVADAVAAGGARGGVFLTGPPRGWIDEAMKDGAAAAARAAAFLLPPAPSAADGPPKGGKL